MSPTPSRPTTPARRQQSVRTDETLLDAAVAVADTEGWGGLTPGHLAEVTGLSRPTVLKRHPDRPALGAAVWRARLAEPLRSALGALVATCDRAPVSPDDLLASLEPFLHPDQSMRAAAELLLVSSYVPEVALAIDETLGVDLTAWCTPHRGRATRTSAARRTFVVAIALGFTIEARRHAGLELDMVEEVDRLAAALARPSAPTRLPAARAEHLDAPAVFDTGEPAWDTVLQATLDCVGERGYDASTIEVIAARSGYSRTVIFRRYGTKAELFNDATSRMLAPAVRLNHEYQVALGERHPPAIVEACMVREFMRPELRRLRVINTEQTRLSWHNQVLQQALRDALVDIEAELAAAWPTLSGAQLRAKIITELAITQGLQVFEQLRPEAWALPFDVVLVPWREES